MTLERLLATAKLIDLDLSSFQFAKDYQSRYGLEIEDAIILSAVIADLKIAPGVGQHLFANRNRKDFDDPGITTDLTILGCDVV